MPLGFWKKLKTPIMAIAPMSNVTDAAFRQMFVKYGPPDVMWTEFVSVEGLLSKGKERLLPDLWFDKKEHPIVAQIFGAKPEQFAKVGEIIQKLGFDGIDINMGCPDRAIEKQGAGAALMKNPDLAKQIIRALKKGAGKLPISVKTRIGYNKNQIADWIPALLEEDLSALTIHWRTRKEMSDVPAHWNLAPQVVNLRNKYAPKTLLLGNGDLNSLTEAYTRVKEFGLDGAMIGRGIFGNPWFFSDKTPSMQEKLTAMLEHTEIFEQLYHSNLSKKAGALKSFSVMKKHYKAYTNGFDGAKELRAQLMETNNALEVKEIIRKFLATIK